MNSIVHDVLSALNFDEPQVFKNLVIIPILDGKDSGPDYVTLSEALERKWISIKEVSKGGSVPELRVVNKGEVPVLLLDGEE